MVSSVSRSSEDATAGGDIFVWVRARPWFYPCAVLVLWAFVPGLRRVIDWRTSFRSVSIISLVPLLSLVPAAVLLFASARLRELGRWPVAAAWTWIGAFAYAYVIGVVTGNVASATYTLLNFLLPMFFGLYACTIDIGNRATYERIAKFVLALAVLVSMYAVYQYVSPPPWDVYWMNQTKYVSIGTPYPFSLRPFSTLNAPAPFADFLIAALILNFPRLHEAKPRLLVAFAVTIAALVLTLVRGDWIAIVLAVSTFVALRPNKLRNVTTLVVATIVLGICVQNAGVVFGNSQVGVELSRRFETFTDLSTDTSFRDREQYFGSDLAGALAQPTGQGLGVVGTAAKLGAAGATVDFDNGYIGRFVEMGYFGTLLYVLTIAGTLVVTWRRWRTLDRARDSYAASIAAAALGIQVALVFLDTSADHHSGLAGMFFWLSIALVFGGARRERVVLP